MSKSKKLSCVNTKEIDINIEEFSEIKNLISQTDIKDTGTFNFISVNQDFEEEEFLKIVSAGKRGAGLYQKSLLGRYIEAKREEDYGYIKDIFEKARILNENMKRIENLKKNKAFMKEWRKNFGKLTPESILKNTGEMRRINTIENLSM